MMQGLLIGGGIGGLTTAVAMQQNGMQVRVYEAAEAFDRTGAGIVLAVNAMRILDKMGLSDAVYRQGNELNGLNITNEALLPLSKNNLPYFSKKYGCTHVAIHRTDLHRILHGALKDEVLETDKNCKDIREEGRMVVADFEDGISAQGDYLLGIDGIRSTIRKHLFPGAAVRNVNQICWRGVLEFDLPAKYRHHAIEAWGKGRCFGFARISADKVYWYALINKHDNGFDFRNRLKDELGKQFSAFAPLIRQLISGTPENTIIRNELMDIKPLNRWYTGRVCLMGDAAHAMTPHLGQGACQAIEDAWMMASLMKETKNPAYAFPEFQKVRKPRTDYAGRLSYRVGQMSQYENSLLVGLRNRVMKFIPQTFTKKKYDKIFAPGYE